MLSVQCESSNLFDILDEELLTIIGDPTTHVVQVDHNEFLRKKQHQQMSKALKNLTLLQKYMDVLSEALPGEGTYSREVVFQLRGIVHLARGESQLAFEQLESALKLWDDTDVTLETSGVRLTKRETEVAGLVSVGLSNEAIAEKLFVSSRTVTTHLDRIYKKLEIHSRTALAHYMARQRSG